MSGNGTPTPVKHICVHASLALTNSVKAKVVKAPPPKPPWHKRVSDLMDWARRIEWLFDTVRAVHDWISVMFSAPCQRSSATPTPHPGRACAARRLRCTSSYRRWPPSSPLQPAPEGDRGAARPGGARHHYMEKGPQVAAMRYASNRTLLSRAAAGPSRKRRPSCELRQMRRWKRCIMRCDVS